MLSADPVFATLHSHSLWTALTAAFRKLMFSTLHSGYHDISVLRVPIIHFPAGYGLVAFKVPLKIQSSLKCKAREKFRSAAYVMICKQEIFYTTQQLG